ncbi:hypothetical protein ACJMK2_025653 [Sinanodonta woodiana]|uniref:Ig-like domain-containing protein n=1 Tax=Sinanodonta woodiana TaxID=1069815 RepID=A0ABD3XJJ9_SINWO
MNDFLTITKITIDDTFDIYTCLESDGGFESDPYNIETNGPTSIQFSQSTLKKNEYDILEVGCSTDCYPHCSVEWRTLYLPAGHNKVLSNNYTLTITNVTRQMSGNYSCKVQNLVTGKYVESSIPMNVYYGPDKSVLNTSNSIIEVDEFDSITIGCTAQCFPPCSITWTEKNANNIVRDAVLSLVNVSANASYECIAYNKVTDIRTVSHTINLYVKLDETLIPRIGVYRHNVSDSSVVLKCHSLRKPKGKYYWMVNGSQVKHTDKYLPDNDLLSIRHLTAEDQNNSYTCTEPGTNFLSNQFWIKAFGPTAIKFSPKDLVFQEHICLNISCHADCFPLCSFHWYKWNTSSAQKTIWSEENALQIMNVSREMYGNYSCKVQNIITGVFNESTLSMDVIYGPDEIFFNTSNKIIEVEEFDSITIVCTAECFPTCLITWTENYTENIIRRGADLQLLNVNSNGTYTCHAMNPKKANAAKFETVVIHVKYDATLTPKVVVVKYNASDSSIVLGCRSYRTLTGSFSWRVNGSMLVNSDVYYLDNVFLFIRRISDDDQYNAYTCTEPISGFQSDPFSMKTYGPDEIVINSFENISEVYKFGSATLSCSADCFPPCLLRWTFSNRDNVTEGGELRILNVTSNVSLTCHASNPINMNATASKTTNITLKSADRRQKESTVDNDMEPTSLDIWYLIYAVLSIGGVGVILAVVCCFWKKYKHCTHVHIVSNDTITAHADIDGSNQDEILSEHYWTIATNTRGKFYTAIDININEEQERPLDPAQSVLNEFDRNTIARHQRFEELEVYLHSMHSDSIYIDTSLSNSVEREGYINPIPSDPAKCNEDIDQICSNSIESNTYLHPTHSDPYAIEICFDPSSSNSYKDDKSTDGSIPSCFGERDQYTDPVRSDAVKRDAINTTCHAVNLQSAGLSDRIRLDAVAIDSCIVQSKPNVV